MVYGMCLKCLRGQKRHGAECGQLAHISLLACSGDSASGLRVWAYGASYRGCTGIPSGFTTSSEHPDRASSMYMIPILWVPKVVNRISKNQKVRVLKYGLLPPDQGPTLGTFEHRGLATIDI